MSYSTTTFPMDDLCFDDWFDGKIVMNIQIFSAPIYCAQELRLKFKRLCTQNWNVRQL
jgi:hypothetical protein